MAAYDNFDEETFEGILFMLDNRSILNTGMIKLRATFDNEKRELWPGQFVRTRLILSTLPNAVVIPFYRSANDPLRADRLCSQTRFTVEQRT